MGKGGLLSESQITRITLITRIPVAITLELAMGLLSCTGGAEARPTEMGADRGRDRKRDFYGIL